MKKWLSRRGFASIFLFFLIVTPIVLLLLPADFFNEGQVVCPSRLLFGVECPGCGLTRGVMHLIHLDFDSAAYFNRASFVALPLMIFYWFRNIGWCWERVRPGAV